MRNRLRSANADNVMRLVRELHVHLARPGLRAGKADENLQAAASSIARDFREERTSFGEMAQGVVSAVARHNEAVATSPHGVRSGDARLARALACYLDEEIRVLADLFGDSLPGYIGHDVDCCREMLAWDLETGLLAFETWGVDGPEYRWTASARELLSSPRPVKPDETRLLRADFDDLYAQG